MSREPGDLPTLDQPYDKLRPDQLPRDPSRDGPGWTFTTHEQGGAEPTQCRRPSKLRTGPGG